MADKKVNKFIYFGDTIFDISGDTVTADKVLSPYTFHTADGNSATGSCTYDADTSDGTTKVAEALDGTIFYTGGTRKVGTMPNKGSVTGTISTVSGFYTIPLGYHDGSGKVSIASTEQAKIIADNIRENVTILGVTGTMSGSEGESSQDSKTVSPGKTQQTITPDAGYTCLRQVIVNAINYVTSENAAGGLTVTIS